MKVSREVINDSIHLITDYQYENDNIGIDLNLLNNEKSKIIKKIPSLFLNEDYTSFDFNKNELKLEANLEFSNDNIYTVLKQNKNDIERIKIEDDIFAEEMISTCLINKKSVKNLPSYISNINNKIESMTNEALENDFLLKLSEYKYKLYIYNNDNELLGISNRLIKSRDDNMYILGEYIGKKIECMKLKIDMCVNSFLTIQFKDVIFNSATNGTIKYIKVDFSDVYYRKSDVQYESIEMKYPKTLALPNQNDYNDIEDYESILLDINSSNELMEFFKLNKISKVPTININKYLIW
jgi:hypothetical protein